jgi:hypothetical protein
VAARDASREAGVLANETGAAIEAAAKDVVRAVDEAENAATRGVPKGLRASVPRVDPDAPTPRRHFFGARGRASGRRFDDNACGGPIRRLAAAGTSISSDGVDAALQHLQRFVDGTLEGPEAAMVQRLRAIADGTMQPMSYDVNFYTHELDEAARYAALGYGAGPLSGDEMYDVWNNVHTAALEDYCVRDADLYFPGTRP